MNSEDRNLAYGEARIQAVVANVFSSLSKVVIQPKSARSKKAPVEGQTCMELPPPQARAAAKTELTTVSILPEIETTETPTAGVAALPVLEPAPVAAPLPTGVTPFTTEPVPELTTPMLHETRPAIGTEAPKFTVQPPMEHSSEEVFTRPPATLNPAPVAAAVPESAAGPSEVTRLPEPVKSLIEWLPRPRAKGDFIMHGMARMILPPVELVADALAGAGDHGRAEGVTICRLWSIAFLADRHCRTPHGKRFRGPGPSEAARYVEAGIPVKASRAAGEISRTGARNGGEYSLSGRGGLGHWLYGEFHLAALGETGRSERPVGTAHDFDPLRHLYTNDGHRNFGGRVIATGDQMMTVLKLTAGELSYPALREYVFQQIARAEAFAEEAALNAPPRRQWMERSNPNRVVRVEAGGERAAGQRVVELHYGIARAGGEDELEYGGSYLSVVFGADGMNDWLIPFLSDGRPLVGRIQLNIDMVGPSTLRLRLGNQWDWTLTERGSVQASSLNRINVPQFSLQTCEVIHYSNVLVSFDERGAVVIEVPPLLFQREEQGGNGTKSKRSVGSPARRRKTLFRNPPNCEEFRPDEEDNVPPGPVGPEAGPVG